MVSGDRVICVTQPLAKGLYAAVTLMVPMMRDNQWPLVGEEYIVEAIPDENHIILCKIGNTPDNKTMGFSSRFFTKCDISELLNILNN